KPRTPPPPGDRFLATIYDYSNNRTVEVTGSLRAGRRLHIEDSGRQPWPTHEEFTDAVRIIRRHPELGPGLGEGRFRPYRPMPPLASLQLPDGRFERTIAVGLV